jgi:hypothetical protein
MTKLLTTLHYIAKVLIIHAHLLFV